MRDTVIVYTAVAAKELLKQGYRIIDLKKDKFDEDGKRTIFIFKNEEGLEESLKRFYHTKEK